MLGKEREQEQELHTSSFFPSIRSLALFLIKVHELQCTALSTKEESVQADR